MPQVTSYYCRLCQKVIDVAKVDLSNLTHKASDSGCVSCAQKKAPLPLKAHKVIRQILTVTKNPDCKTCP